MIVGGQTEAHASSIIDYPRPFDQGFMFMVFHFIYIKTSSREESFAGRKAIKSRTEVDSME